MATVIERPKSNTYAIQINTTQSKMKAIQINQKMCILLVNSLDCFEVNAENS
jgi:hypothetical protein